MFITNSLFSRLNTTPRKESEVLPIPEHYVDTIVILYHSSIFAGHQCVIKTYLTINETFHTNLMHYPRAYIKGCHICQLHRNRETQPRQLQHRTNTNYKALASLNMDFKVMPRSYKGHKFISVVIDEVPNFMVAIPFHQSISDRRCFDRRYVQEV